MYNEIDFASKYNYERYYAINQYLKSIGRAHGTLEKQEFKHVLNGFLSCILEDAPRDPDGLYILAVEYNRRKEMLHLDVIENGLAIASIIDNWEE